MLSYFGACPRSVLMLYIVFWDLDLCLFANVYVLVW